MVHIKVAVRIRPMSQKESIGNEISIVSNSEKSILVTNPKVSEKCDGGDSRQRVRRFAVDYCYDPNYPELATQEAVFEEVGMEVLGHMFEGYNACVLAYGHSASGKTYTMMGTEEEPGLTPRVCRELCRRMKASLDNEHHVTVSFLEIYNEKVRDLLVDDEPGHNGWSLRVREHPKLGPYVQDLSEHVVDNETTLLELLNLGNSRRSTAATETNVFSSRSHAVFTIRFKQVGEHVAKSSKVHLVDLAGSERASAIQSRARLKEGAKINKSLVTLGNVISALADSTETAWGKQWQPFVPYRDSVLTWLLKDTLGGNSNTIMIATISPASSCYTDTVNTLRYAKRTKKIVNQPTVNEDPKIRTIRELRDEVSRLKTMLLSYSSVGLQTEDYLFPHTSRWTVGVSMEVRQPHTDLLEHLAVAPSSPLRPESPEIAEEGVEHSIATLDILPTNKQNLCVPVTHVSEINAVNGTGVNRVIADFAGNSVSNRQTVTSSCGGIVPRVPRPVLKRCRTPLRRGTPYWNMLHRSRPDLIKGIGSRGTDAPSTSGQHLTDALSQSTSDNSLHSSGSADFRPRLQAAASLSRTSSVGDASGGSSPTQSKPVGRKKEAKRAEIVASVTSRLYAIKKKPDPRMEALQAAEKDDEEDDELEELKLCKRARMKLFDLSRKLAMAKKVRRVVDSDTQTETNHSTLRLKEKNVATEVQGVLEVQTCGTNTPKDPDFSLNDQGLVMNQVFLPSGVNLILECGTSLKFEGKSSPSQSADCGSQTFETRDQATSPKKFPFERKVLGVEDANFSDDSLESDDSEYVKNAKSKISNKCNSCVDFRKSDTKAIMPHRSHSHPNLAFKKESKIGKRIEKSLEPISRFPISGTNAVYEYDPNAGIPDKIIYSNSDSIRHFVPHTNSEIIYPQYKNEIANSFPFGDFMSSSEEGLSKSLPNESAEDNLSSGTCSASSTGSMCTSDTSSEEFVFLENVAPHVQQRELYTITENSEPSCSNRSTPVSSRSPKMQTLDTNKSDNEILSKATNDGDLKEPNNEATKKVNWAEMECSGKTQFVNFKYKPSPMGDKTYHSSEGMFPSEDSITFVFLGGKQQETSVLMELIKRSLLGGSDPNDMENRSRSRGVQCSSKLMRSVSVDTAVIALSKLARHQRPASFLHRSTSLSTISTEVQVNLDEGGKETTDDATQCNIKEMVDASVDIRPSECAVQCKIQNTITYSLGTSTTTDQETTTDAELREITTQTDDQQEFECGFPSLPRVTPELPKTSPSEHWSEIKSLILGTKKDLFPQYLAEEEPEKNNNGNRKTVSWTDIKDHGEDDCSTLTRRVRFSEPDADEGRPHTLPRRRQPATEKIAAFIKEATSLLHFLHNSPSSDSENDDKSLQRPYSTNCLLRRRKRTLPHLKVEKVNVNCNTSVQTDAEQSNRCVQTGGFASSLVGPPLRSKTANFWKESEGSNPNLTWPRRRVANKPPTGLKVNPSPRCSPPGRSGSVSSRISTPSTGWRGQSPVRSTSTSRQDFPSNRRYITDELYGPSKGGDSIEESRRRLQNAIEQDRLRQQRFIGNIDFCFNTNFKYQPEPLKQAQYPDNDDYISIYESTNKDWNLKPSDALLATENTSPLDFWSRQEGSKESSEYKGNSDFSAFSRQGSLKSPRNHRFEQDENEQGLSQSSYSENAYRRRSSKVSSDAYSVINPCCGCSCHKINKAIGSEWNNHCHTCCVPCSTDSKRLYKSEPMLNSPCDCNSSSNRPSAHLQHLISVRKSIVDSQKTFK